MTLEVDGRSIRRASWVNSDEGRSMTPSSKLYERSQPDITVKRFRVRGAWLLFGRSGTIPHHVADRTTQQGRMAPSRSASSDGAERDGLHRAMVGARRPPRCAFQTSVAGWAVRQRGALARFPGARLACPGPDRLAVHRRTGGVLPLRADDRVRAVCWVIDRPGAAWPPDAGGADRQPGGDAAPRDAVRDRQRRPLGADRARNDHGRRLGDGLSVAADSAI